MHDFVNPRQEGGACQAAAVTRRKWALGLARRDCLLHKVMKELREDQTRTAASSPRVCERVGFVGASFTASSVKVLQKTPLFFWGKYKTKLLIFTCQSICTLAGKNGLL